MPSSSKVIKDVQGARRLLAAKRHAGLSPILERVPTAVLKTYGQLYYFADNDDCKEVGQRVSEKA